MNVLEFIQSQLSDDVIARLAGSLGEGTDDTRHALTAGALPAVLSGIVSRYADGDAVHHLLALLRNREPDGDILPQLGRALGGGAQTEALRNLGKSLLGTFIGSRSDAVAELITAQTAVRRSSASSLLALAAPLALAALQHMKTANNLDAQGLSGLLRSLRGPLATDALPGLPAALGVAALGASPTTATASPNIARWIIVPVALALLAWSLRSCQQQVMQSKPPGAPLPVSALTPVAAAPAPAPAPAAVPTVAAAAPEAPAEVPAASAAPTATPPAAAPTAPAAPMVPLAEVTAGLATESVAYELAQFLADPTTTAPRSFVLRDLVFATGTANISADSQRTLQDVARVLKAFGTAHVMLQGHTDNRGDARANYDLSQARADATQNILVSLGISPERLTSGGFGADRPLEDNATAAGRARNRRTELLVTVK